MERHHHIARDGRVAREVKARDGRSLLDRAHGDPADFLVQIPQFAELLPLLGRGIFAVRILDLAQQAVALAFGKPRAAEEEQGTPGELVLVRSLLGGDHEVGTRNPLAGNKAGAVPLAVARTIGRRRLGRNVQDGAGLRPQAPVQKGDDGNQTFHSVLSFQPRGGICARWTMHNDYPEANKEGFTGQVTLDKAID